MSNQVITSWTSENDYKMLVTFVYVKYGFYDRRQLWAHMEGLFGRNFPWLVIRDFNCIGNDGERVGGWPRSRLWRSSINALTHVELWN